MAGVWPWMITRPFQPLFQSRNGSRIHAQWSTVADFGVACKPDLHVMRSLRHLGIWSSTSDQVTTAKALAVNRAIRKMVLRTGKMTPARMRRVDIELVSLSRRGVIAA